MESPKQPQGGSWALHCLHSACPWVVLRSKAGSHERGLPERHAVLGIGRDTSLHWAEDGLVPRWCCGDLERMHRRPPAGQVQPRIRGWGKEPRRVRCAPRRPLGR
ncbi:hypothetical protein NDU88_001428 [Pleurodeles waltl]|uniref:Uncharacterized protein n=1 Tax=Pleurodeles waltl TaxID=8319 RepID=A0AAV7LXM6_PLEWA|nr:hypothetical protein NDU88_001428 [Pleurodeles waltl]